MKSLIYLISRIGYLILALKGQNDRLIKHDYVSINVTNRSQTCKYKEGGDWAKRWVESQVYILKVKCPLIGHYCLH